MAVTEWRRVCRVKTIETTETHNNYNYTEASDNLVVVAVVALLVQKNWNRI